MTILYRILVLAILLITLYSCEDNYSNSSDLEDRDFIRSIMDTTREISMSKGYSYAKEYLDSLVQINNHEALFIITEGYRITNGKENVTYRLNELKKLKEKALSNPPSNIAMSRICINLSTLYSIDKQFQMSLNELIEALSYLEHNIDLYSLEISNIYGQMAYIAKHFTNEYKISSIANQKSIEIAFKYGHKRMAIHRTYSICNTLIGKEKWDEVEKISRNALNLNYKGEELTYSEALVYLQLYKVYSVRNNIDSMESINQLMFDSHLKKNITTKSYSDFIVHKLYVDMNSDYFNNYRKDVKFLNVHLKNTPYLMSEFYISRAVYSYKQGNIDDFEKFLLISLSELEGVWTNEDINLKRMLDQLQLLEHFYKKQNRTKDLLWLSKKMNKLNSMRYDILQKRTEMYEHQIEFWNNQKMKLAEQKTKSQAFKVRIYAGLLSLSILSITALIYLLFLLRRSSKEINKRSIEFQAITESAPVGICRVDKNLNVSWSNERLHHIFNIPYNSEINLILKDVLSEETCQMILKQFSKADKRKDTVLEGALTHDYNIVKEYSPDLRWIKLDIISLQNNTDDEVYYMIVCHDNTKDKLKQNKLQNKKDKITQMNKQLIIKSKIIADQNNKLQKSILRLQDTNESLKEFAAVAAHDLKAPLRTIHGFSELLFKKYADVFVDQDQKLLDHILLDCQNLKELIDGLLSYSKISSKEFKLEPVNLNSKIDGAIENLKLQIVESNAELTVPKKLPYINGQELLLHQLFLNLIANAIKFRKLDQPCRIDISAQPLGKDYVHIKIRDNGIGIEEKYFERIFHVFQRLHSKSQYDGSGIGLATCKRIVETCGGEIWVESIPNKGSTFNITLQVSNKYSV